MELTTGFEPVTSSLPRKCSTTELRERLSTRPPRRDPGDTRAGDGTRTRDIQLGRLTLYQLSYSRMSLQSGGRRIRTFEGIRRQIYSLLPLAARASLQR